MSVLVLNMPISWGSRVDISDTVCSCFVAVSKFLEGLVFCEDYCMELEIHLLVVVFLFCFVLRIEVPLDSPQNLCSL